MRQGGELRQGRVQTFPQFPGGAAGKGDGQEFLGPRAFFQQPLQTADEHAGFARAGTGQNQNRSGTGTQSRVLFVGKSRRNGRGNHVAFLFRRGFCQAQKREGVVGGAALRWGRCRCVFARASGPGQSRQALAAAAHVAQFFGFKHAHHAVLTVKAALADHLTAPHAGHGFAQRLPVGAEVRFRQMAEDVQFRPQLAQQAAVAFLHLA